MSHCAVKLKKHTMKPLISGHPKYRIPPNNGLKIEDRITLVQIPCKETSK